MHDPLSAGSPTGLLADAPVKRMSILERRPADTRDDFQRHWRDVHGGMVAAMPHLHAYHQNHVVETFACGSDAFPADGFVEQLWRSPREMQRGYCSPAVAVMIADEPNYLGHGSNYAILATQALDDAPAGEKLICSIRHGGDVGLADHVHALAAGLARPASILRDDVIATIAKPNLLPALPRPVDMFLHIGCADAAAATRLGHALADAIAALPLPDRAGAGLHRVRTVRIAVAGSAGRGDVANAFRDGRANTCDHLG